MRSTSSRPTERNSRKKSKTRSGSANRKTEKRCARPDVVSEHTRVHACTHERMKRMTWLRWCHLRRCHERSMRANVALLCEACQR